MVIVGYGLWDEAMEVFMFDAIKSVFGAKKTKQEYDQVGKWPFKTDKDAQDLLDIYGTGINLDDVKPFGFYSHASFTFHILKALPDYIKSEIDKATKERPPCS